LESRQF
jgi:pyruvate dehydrogenase complex dehydrogenase (E1) component